MDNTKPFAPSLDWGHALVDSLLWIGRAWAIAAVCTLVVLIAMAKFTTWGRQFWYVTGAYFTGPHSVRPWLSLAALLLSVIIGVRLSVLFSYQSNDLYTAAQTAVQGMATGNQAVKDSGVQGFWTVPGDLLAYWPRYWSPASWSTCSSRNVSCWPGECG